MRKINEKQIEDFEANMSNQYRSKFDIEMFIWKLRQSGESHYADLLELGHYVMSDAELEEDFRCCDACCCDCDDED